MRVSVLLVEDDFDLATTILDYLELDGMICDHTFNGPAGLQLATDNPYDVILLDINLPRMNGLIICQQLRDIGIDTPILMLTARDTIDDKVAGFRAGTDDYLVKPFVFDELIMRIQALSRRRSGQVQKLKTGELVMDLNLHEATRQQQLLKLTPSGWRLLEVLMPRSPNVISKRELERTIWPEETPNSDALKVHLYNLRCAVDKPFATALIETVPNKGVRLRASKEISHV